MSCTFADHLPADFAAQQLRADALAGLTSTPKTLPPKWLYDKLGSDLFEEITRLPEYYPTRAEREILQLQAAAIVAGCDTLVELGSGSSEKTRLLLDPLTRANSRASYVALDVSAVALAEACQRLNAAYPMLAVHAVRADFEHHLDVLPADGRRLVAFLGGTIGNFEPASRAEFLAGVRTGLDAGDRFLLGADLVKSPAVLVPAYDDASGVTAAFNLNVLQVLNDGLGADFDLSAFAHVAVWDAEQEWIEMRLRSLRRQRVRVAALDLEIEFAEGEEMRTEISAKFRRDGLTAEMCAAGFAEAGWWTDQAGRFSLSLWTCRP